MLRAKACASAGYINMNGPSYFEIQADDVARAVNFYTAVFGWVFTKAEGLPVEYWRIATNTSMGGILQRFNKRADSI